jgi:hypothetical protein
METESEKIEMLRKKIDKALTKKTGLKTEEDLEIYSYFCHHADLNNGIVMYDDVAHDIYHFLLSKASGPMKILETAYWTSVGNHEDTNYLEARHFKSPLSRKAREIYSEYFKKFLKKHLLGISEKSYNGTFYPVLKGYNYLNDAKFYRKVGRKRSQGRELRL